MVGVIKTLSFGLYLEFFIFLILACSENNSGNPVSDSLKGIRHTGSCNARIENMVTLRVCHYRIFVLTYSLSLSASLTSCRLTKLCFCKSVMGWRGSFCSLFSCIFSIYYVDNPRQNLFWRCSWRLITSKLYLLLTSPSYTPWIESGRKIFQTKNNL